MAIDGRTQLFVIPGRRNSGEPGIHNHSTVDMDSGFLREPVIGPATSGRTRRLGPGMTGGIITGSAYSTP